MSIWRIALNYGNEYGYVVCIDQSIKINGTGYRENIINKHNMLSTHDWWTKNIAVDFLVTFNPRRVQGWQISTN